MSQTETSSKKRAKNRPQATISASLEKNLHAYVTAACAAGVTLLACAPPADAKVVYTPANDYILPKGTLNIDIDHNGSPDFQLSNAFTTFQNGRDGSGNLKIMPQNSRNAVWGTGTYASALPAGARVGPNKHFQSAHNGMAGFHFFCTSTCAWNSLGPWVDVTRRYLGLEFSVKGKIHYGWARLNVTVNARGIYAVLTGYAYETVPNKPIVTGNTKGDPSDIKSSGQSATASFRPIMRPPATLGLLAQGASGLDIWRKRRATAN